MDVVTNKIYNVVLVCGGRNYKNQTKVHEVLDSIDPYPFLIIQGGARGADSFAKDWAEMNYVQSLTVPANWPKHGKSAGILRNFEMMLWKPNIVIAFPGGKGTAHMVSLAKKDPDCLLIEVFDETV